MNRQIRLILVLWTALVVMGSALAGDVGCCDPLCCEEPCEPANVGLDPCACCALSGPVSDDPSLPAAPVAKAAPAVAVTPTPISVLPGAPTPAAVVPVTLPEPPPARTPVLRI